MGLKLVNTAPGSVADIVKPGQPLLFGARSETGTILPSSIRSTIGFSGINHRGDFPEEEQSFSLNGVSTALTTTERRLPINAVVPRTISSGNLVFTKGTNSDNDQGIYEITTPIESSASVLGYFKFKVKTAWALINPDWCNVSNMTGMYFGLEHGGYNTACYAFLRKNVSAGSLMIGGPLQTFSSTRPAQAEISAFTWGSLSDDTEVEVWLYFNSEGYQSPFIPTNSPLVEIWTRRVGIDAGPIYQAIIPALSLGEFPPKSSSFSNLRDGPSLEARLIFGNAGRTGDVLEMVDWAIFPEFRRAVVEGQATSLHTISIVPDGPVRYSVAKGKLPRESIPSKWDEAVLPGSSPTSATMKTQAGKNRVPVFAVLRKDTAVLSGFERKEPRIDQAVDGFMVESFMSGTMKDPLSYDSLGAGFGVDDGVSSYRIAMVQNPSLRTVGLLKDSSDPELFTNYHVPNSDVDIDWRSLKLTRLTVDRRRARILVDVDEKRVIDIPLSSTVPVSGSAYGRVLFGHLISTAALGDLNVASLAYLSKYRAWEGQDGLLPTASLVSTTDPSYPFTLVSSGGGSVSMGSGILADNLIIDKTSFDTSGSKLLYTKPEPFADSQGIQVEFDASVLNYQGKSGSQFDQLSWTGAGIKLYLGNKVVSLGFYDAGTNGRVIAIMPGSGTVADICGQTSLGRKFSAQADWTQPRKYRLVYRAYDKLELWTDAVVGSPAISIPWNGSTAGFDLPEDITPSSLVFGHFDEDTASRTAWKFVRWGQGHGYDVAVTQLYKDGPQSYHFDGKVFGLTEVDE